MSGITIGTTTDFAANEFVSEDIVGYGARIGIDSTDNNTCLEVKHISFNPKLILGDMGMSDTHEDAFIMFIN